MAITSFLSIIYIWLISGLTIQIIFSISNVIRNILYYYYQITGEKHLWLYLYSGTLISTESLKIVINIIIFTFLYNIISNKSKIDTFNINWLKKPFYLLIFSLTLTLFILKSRENWLELTLYFHEVIFIFLIFYFIIFMTQNFFSFYKKFTISKYGVVLIAIYGFYTYWNYIAKQYHKHQLLWFFNDKW